jgi:hypothetical protein
LGAMLGVVGTPVDLVPGSSCGVLKVGDPWGLVLRGECSAGEQVFDLVEADVPPVVGAWRARTDVRS